MKQVRPVLNPEKDMSASRAFDPTKNIRPRYTMTEEESARVPWGECPDDDRFIAEDFSPYDLDLP